jgi:Uma2 family endonuclease
MLDVALIAPEKPRRLTRAEYDEIVAAGVFGNDRVELLEGVVVSMSPNHPEHASPVQLLTEALVRALAGRAMVRGQLPLVASDDSEPEPDVAVVPVGDYSRQHPDAAYLVIEVASSSLRKDRLVKAPLYAKSGFQEYWVVDVGARTIEVYRGPSADGWAVVTRHGAGEAVHLEAFPDVSVTVDAIMR